MSFQIDYLQVDSKLNLNAIRFRYVEIQAWQPIKIITA